MVSVSKYLKDTEDTAPRVYVSVSWIHFKSIFPNLAKNYPCRVSVTREYCVTVSTHFLLHIRGHLENRLKKCTHFILALLDLR